MTDANVSPQQPLSEERIGYCQDCGKPLTAATIRTVGSGVFCEPCLERRLAGASNAAPPPPYSFNTYPPPDGVFPPLDGSTPHPLLAGFLGLIPGVGAMYNGQFAKGFVHLIAFVVLVSLSDNVNGVFVLLVFGWIFYMVFDAYQTAKARRAGLPLPDPFGLNNIGDRMGIRNWNPNTTATTTPPQQSPYRGADWVGYVPPTQFATAPPPSSGPMPDMPVPPPPADYGRQYADDLTASIKAQAMHDAGYPSYPGPAPGYTSTYTGEPFATVPNGSIPPAPMRRFPVGAIWLIALGVLFLVGNIEPSLRLSWRWILPVALAALSIWIFVRRMSSSAGQFPSIACALRAPVMLMTLAVLLALQTGHVLTLGQTWPVFFIVFGAVLLLERTAGRTPYFQPPVNTEEATPASAIVTELTPADPTRWHPTGDAAAKGEQ